MDINMRNLYREEIWKKFSTRSETICIGKKHGRDFPRKLGYFKRENNTKIVAPMYKLRNSFVGVEYHLMRKLESLFARILRVCMKFL